MTKDIDHLLAENEDLLRENEVLYKMLTEAKELIEAIKNGNIDAIIIADKQSAKVLVDKASDQTYRLFIENMSEGVVTLDPDGVILFSNSSFAEIVELPLQKVIGKMFRNFISEEHIENFELFFSEFPLNNSAMELSIVNQTGSRTHYIVSLNRLQLEELVVLNLVCTNITALKTAERELLNVNENLAKAVKDLSRSENTLITLNNRLNENIKILEDTNIELENFVQVASNDIQKPIRKIITYSSMLIQDYYQIKDNHGKHFIHGMESASKRMKMLISDILNYSELSQKDFTLQPGNLQAILEEVLSDLEHSIKEANATINIRKELPVLEINASQIRQLFHNLIGNCLKFKRVDTALEISITYQFTKGKEIIHVAKDLHNEDFCVLNVADNGIGFSPEYSNRIFAIFQKLNKDAFFSGAGIGLAMCKKIVEQHNGFISAVGKPNQGAIFTVVLPVSQQVKSPY